MYLSTQSIAFDKSIKVLTADLVGWFTNGNCNRDQGLGVYLQGAAEKPPTFKR